MVDVLGYLTASGGGLTRAEISHLTGLPGWMLLDLFSSVFGRTLESRTARDTERVYLFAHETLREQAAELFQTDLPRYRQELHRWADRWREQGWPADTPRYLLAPYARLLATIGDPARLARFATDPARHDCMLAREHNDGLALAEILSARRALVPAARPDVTALGKLAVSEWRLQVRTRTSRSACPRCGPASATPTWPNRWLGRSRTLISGRRRSPSALRFCPAWTPVGPIGWPRTRSGPPGRSPTTRTRERGR